MNKQKKFISALLITAIASHGTIVANAQSADPVSTSATAAAADTTSTTPGTEKATTTAGTNSVEIPILKFTPKPTDSSIKVEGTKSWDSALVLNPTTNGDVTINLDLANKVPAGTKISLKDGDKELASGEVAAGGKVTLVAKDLPKDLNKLSLVATGDAVKQLQNLKCTADKGIDIDGSKEATLDAIKAFETEYETAAKGGTGGQKVLNENVGPDGKVTRVVQLPDTTKTTTVTEVVPGKDSTTTSVTPGTPGGTSFDAKQFFEKIGPLLGIGGAVGLGSLLAPILGNMMGVNLGSANPLDELGKIVNDLAKNIGIDLSNVFNHDNPIDGLMGEIGKRFPQLQDIKSKIDQALAGATEAFNNAKAQIQDMINKAGIKFDLSGIKPEHIAMLVAIPVVGIVIKLIADAVKKSEGTPGTTDTAVVPGADSTNVKTTTTVVPGGTTTIVEDPTAQPDTPTKDLPTPPEWIEKELSKRDLPTKPEANGISFDIETGSIIDCALTPDNAPSTDTPATNSPAPTGNVKPKEMCVDESALVGKDTTSIDITGRGNYGIPGDGKIGGYATNDCLEAPAGNTAKPEPKPKDQCVLEDQMNSKGGGAYGIANDGKVGGYLDENCSTPFTPKQANPAPLVQAPAAAPLGIGGGAVPVQLVAQPDYGPKVDTGGNVVKDGFFTTVLKALGVK